MDTNPTLLRPGQDARPLFLVLEISGDEPPRVAFAELVTKDVPIYGLPALGSAAAVCVEGLAAQHIQAIRRIQPRGPYRLAGMSSGAVVAYEMAYQLIGADEPVGFLGMIDAEIAHRYSPQPLSMGVDFFNADDLHPKKLPREWSSSPTARARPITSITEAMAEAQDRPVADIPRACIFEIQGSKHAPGMFCIPGAGANIYCFMPLSEALGPQIGVCGLQHRGMGDSLIPHSSVTAAAKSFVAALKREGRRGPYRLLGHSFGGWIALEMARQLIATGERVAPVIMLDTESPDTPLSEANYSGRLAVLLTLVGTMGMSVARPPQFTEAELRPLDDDAQLRLVVQRLMAAGVLPRAGNHVGMLKQLLQVFASHVNTHYVPESAFPGELVLFQPEELSEADKEADFVPKWLDYAPQMRVLQTPGNHMTMLNSPNVELIAAEIHRIWNDFRD